MRRNSAHSLLIRRDSSLQSIGKHSKALTSDSFTDSLIQWAFSADDTYETWDRLLLWRLNHSLSWLSRIAQQIGEHIAHISVRPAVERSSGLSLCHFRDRAVEAPPLQWDSPLLSTAVPSVRSLRSVPSLWTEPALMRRSPNHCFQRFVHLLAFLHWLLLLSHLIQSLIFKWLVHNDMYIAALDVWHRRLLLLLVANLCHCHLSQALSAATDSGPPSGKTWELSLYELHRTPQDVITDATEIAVSPRSLHSELMCPICLDMLKGTMTTKECLHRFCQECIITALRSGNKECPTCRKKLISKRSLRPDPNFDMLISKIYPSRDEYEAHQERVLAKLNKHHSQNFVNNIEESLRIQSLNRSQRPKKFNEEGFDRPGIQILGNL